MIYGIAYALAPAPVPKHQYVASNLATEFNIALKKCKKCKVYQPVDYKVTDETIVQPDLFITCKEIRKKYLDFPPALVVEILSPATALKDRHTKFDIYQQQRIRYYLIVSPEEETIEVYEIENEEYALRKKNTCFYLHFHIRRL